MKQKFLLYLHLVDMLALVFIAWAPLAMFHPLL